MNSQNINIGHVESHYPPFNFETQSDDRLSDQSQSTAVEENLNSSSSPERQLQHFRPFLTSQIPVTPSPRPIAPFAPTPPYTTSEEESSADLYGPDRLFGPPLVSDIPAASILPPQQVATDLSPVTRRNPRFACLDEEMEHKMAAHEAEMNQAMLTDFRDELTREAGVVTPGVDETPYIQFALEALTKEPVNHNSHSSDESYSHPSPQPIFQKTTSLNEKKESIPKVYDTHLFTQPVAERQSSHEPDIHVALSTPNDIEPLAPPRPSSAGQTLTPEPRMNEDELPDRYEWTPFEPWHKAHLLPLNYKPILLRPVATLGAAALSLTMIILLVFISVYSMKSDGLADYSGSIYGAQWFLFRILPQLLALGLILFAQAIVQTAYRIQPFRMLTASPQALRHGALIKDLYLKSFLIPKVNGAWDVNIPLVLIWVCHLAIPLQSSLFSVILVDGIWRWAAVQGVAWTLVALYTFLTGAFVFFFIVWRHADTGLLWDPRSLADLVSLFARSNNIVAFEGLDGNATKDQFDYQFGTAFNMLTWWHDHSQPRPTRYWYSLGIDRNDLRWHPQKKAKYVSSNETLNDEKDMTSVDNWYLPWYLRTGPLIVFLVISIILSIAIFVLTFLGATSIQGGFLPSVSAAPINGAFSKANFLWSFFPSLLGLFLWLVWQTMENTIRVLTPWAELSRQEGADAKHSLLVDYAATPLPALVAIKALQNKHWRVFALSTLSSIFTFLPVLGGGLFMALTRQSDGVVRMYPNFGAYGIMLGVLVLYCVGLGFILIPDRRRMRLPHSVDCLAEIYSFCVVDEFLADSAKGNGEKRYAFQREGHRWAIVSLRKFTGTDNLGVARRMREQHKTSLGTSKAWGRKGDEPAGSNKLSTRNLGDIV